MPKRQSDCVFFTFTVIYISFGMFVRKQYYVQLSVHDLFELASIVARDCTHTVKVFAVITLKFKVRGRSIEKIV